ncbi:MAG: GNAT family N-acetyltransferase [Pseudomonadota bacterium]
MKLYFEFRPVTRDDLPLIRSWMAQPHWQEWWGDIETELGYIIDMLEGRDTTRPFLFCQGEQPIGYIQYWFVRDAKLPPWNEQSPWVMDFDEDTIGVDLAIGEATNLGKGVGSSALTSLVQHLHKDGFTKIIIDPDVENKRAIRAYEKAGFVPIRVAEESEGAVQLMRWQGKIGQ